jgi:hypothetical protein
MTGGQYEVLQQRLVIRGPLSGWNCTAANSTTTFWAPSAGESVNASAMLELPPPPQLDSSAVTIIDRKYVRYLRMTRTSAPRATVSFTV